MHCPRRRLGLLPACEVGDANSNHKQDIDSAKAHHSGRGSDICIFMVVSFRYSNSANFRGLRWLFAIRKPSKKRNNAGTSWPRNATSGHRVLGRTHRGMKIFFLKRDPLRTSRRACPSPAYLTHDNVLIMREIYAREGPWHPPTIIFPRPSNPSSQPRPTLISCRR